MAYGALASQTGRMVPHVPNRSVCGCAPRAVIPVPRNPRAVSVDRDAVGPRSSRECNIRTLLLSVTAQGRDQSVGSCTRCTTRQRRYFLGKYVLLCRKGFNSPAKRHETANLWIRDSKAAEEPSSEHPRQDKQRLHSNKQRKLLSKKPKRTKHVFERNWPNSRSRHFRKPPSQSANRRFQAKRHHSVQR